MTQPINKPARKTRGDLLREQMILRGEIIQDQEPAGQKKFLIVSIILLLVLAAIVAFSWIRVDLIESQSLQGLVVLMDIRHPLKDLDQQMIEWAVDSNIAVLVLLTKADKLASGARKAQLNMVREAVLAFNGDVQVETFSSLKKQGVDKLRQKLDTWFSEMQPVEETQDGE